MNPYTLHREGLISREERDEQLALKAKMAWAKAKQDHERGRPLTATEKLDNLRNVLMRYVAGDRIEDLCESAQDAVNEVIRVCREHGRCERIFDDLRIEAYAYPHASGKVAWGINSLITGINTKRGIVE
jgi:hypothetical protein